MITLATLPQASEQEVFDQVKTHLLTQNERSGTSGLCLYRGPNDTKCAAGCLMSDEEYDKDFEDNDWFQLTDEHNVTNAHSHLIRNLQKLHDESPVQEWKTELKLLAKNLNLKYND